MYPLWYQHFRHFLGTKSLLASVIAQIIVLTIAAIGHKKSQTVQEILLIVAFGLLVVSIALRPPSLYLYPLGLLGMVAAFLLVTPAIKSLLSPRNKVQKV